MVAQLIENYYYLAASGLLADEAAAAAKASATSLAERFGDQLLDCAGFYLQWGNYGSGEFETAGRVLLYLADVCKQYGDEALSKTLEDQFTGMLEVAKASAQ
jgi:hypothetical protein